MSRAQDALARGFNTLVDWSADTVTLRGHSVPAVFNRTPELTEDPNLAVNFAHRGWTVIELRASDVPTGGDPKAGEILTEPDGHRHRIETVFPRLDIFRLHCSMTN